MRVLVTGSAGYIGSVLCPILEEAGHHVSLFDLEEYRDICFEHEIRPAIEDADAIVHLAAVSCPADCDKNEWRARQVNVSAVRMINRLRGRKPLFYPNTNIGYGGRTKLPLYEETSPLEPKSIYGRTKCEAERLILDHGECVVFRLASLFGISPKMRWHLLLNFMMRESFKMRRLEIYEPYVHRNFLHVRDMGLAFLHAIANYESMKNHVYNVGLDRHPTKGELADMIKAYVPGLSVEFIEGTDPDHRDYIISNEKLKATGWKANYDIDYGMREIKGILGGF